MNAAGRIGPVLSPRVAGLVLLALLGWAKDAAAYQCKHSEDSEYLTLHWSERRIEYAVEEGFEAPYPVVQAAFASWAVEPCTDLIFLPMGTVAPGAEVNVVGAIREGWQEAGYDPVAVAVTSTFYEPATGQLRRARITVNDEDYDFIDLTRECGGGEQVYDYGAVLTHEAGHFIGLDHTSVGAGDRNDPTMAPTVDPCDREKRTLAPDDVAGLCRIYPTGEPPQTCLSLPIQARYVSSQAFGCRTGAVPGPSWPGAVLLLLGISLLRSRTCGRVRERG